MDPNIGKTTDRVRTITPYKVWALLVYRGMDSLSKEEQTRPEVSWETCLHTHKRGVEGEFAWHTTWSITMGHRTCHRWVRWWERRGTGILSSSVDCYYSNLLDPLRVKTRVYSYNLYGTPFLSFPSQLTLVKFKTPPDYFELSWVQRGVELSWVDYNGDHSTQPSKKWEDEDFQHYVRGYEPRAFCFPECVYKKDYLRWSCSYIYMTSRLPREVIQKKLQEHCFDKKISNSHLVQV